MSKQVIQVSFDSMFDTRLGVMDILDPLAAKDLLCDAYYQRRSDDLGLLTNRVTTEQFREAYSKRNIRALKRSRMTSMFRYLKGMVNTLEKEMINTPFTESIELEFNAYPYNLSKEMVDEFMLGFKHYFGYVHPISIVFQTPSELTTHRLKARYSLVIMYDFNEWLAAHQQSVKDKTFILCPEVTIMTPELLATENNISDSMRRTQEELKTLFGGMEIFKATELFYSEFFGLKLNEVGLYCIVPPYHKDQPGKKETQKEQVTP